LVSVGAGYSALYSIIRKLEGKALPDKKDKTALIYDYSHLDKMVFTTTT
jgi:hypothetical protein